MGDSEGAAVNDARFVVALAVAFAGLCALVMAAGFAAGLVWRYFG